METLEEMTPTATFTRGDSKAAVAPRATVHAASASVTPRVHTHSEWPTFILVMGGSATGAAFLGGAFLGSPVGAIVGTVVGIGLGVFLKISHNK